MSAEFSGEDILNISDGRIVQGLLPHLAGSISSDTRKLQEGQWFIALEGKNFDGHDFLGDAFALGAIGAIVSERTNYCIGNKQFPLIAVENSYESYKKFAGYWFHKINPRVITLFNWKGIPQINQEIWNLLSRQKRCFGNMPNNLEKKKNFESALLMPKDTEVFIYEQFNPSVFEVCGWFEITKADVIIFIVENNEDIEFPSTENEIRYLISQLQNSNLNQDLSLFITIDLNEIYVRQLQEFCKTRISAYYGAYDPQEIAKLVFAELV